MRIGQIHHQPRGLADRLLIDQQGRHDTRGVQRQVVRLLVFARGQIDTPQLMRQLQFEQHPVHDEARAAG
jgi:hypothetical protein